MKRSSSRLSACVSVSACVGALLLLISVVQCDEIVINLHTSPPSSLPVQAAPEVPVRRPQTNHAQAPSPSAPVPARRESELATASSEVTSSNSRGDYYGGNYYDDGYLPAAPLSYSHGHAQNYVTNDGGQFVYQHPEHRPHTHAHGHAQAQSQYTHLPHQAPRPQKYHPKQPYHMRPQKQRVSQGHGLSHHAQDAYYAPAETHAEHAYVGEGYGGYGSETSGAAVEGVGAGHVGQSYEQGHTGPIPVPIAIHTEASSDHGAEHPEQHYYSSPVEVSSSHSHGIGWNWVKDIELGEFALLFIPAALLTLVYIFYVAANSPNNAASKYFIDGVGSLGPPVPHRRPSYHHPQPQQHGPSYMQQPQQPPQQHGGGGPSSGGGNANADLDAMQGGGPPPELANLINQLGMPSHPSQFGASGPHSSPPHFGRSLALDRLTQRVHTGIEKGEAMNKH